VFKHLVLAAILAAPCTAFAGQAMSIDDGFAAGKIASSEVSTVIAPMQDGGATDAMREPGAGRGGDDADTHAQADNTPARGAPAGRAVGSDGAASHVHKSHGKTPWQSLLPGVMK
jgi:hypothetical protein